MTQNTTNTVLPQGLESFILWFAQIEAIPVTIRKDFVGHLLETETLDEKSIKFIDDTMNRFLHQEGRRTSELRQQYASIKAELEREKTPKTSFLNRVAKEAKDYMLGLANNFTKKFKQHESEKLKAEESTEEAENADKIAQLKAALG